MRVRSLAFRTDLMVRRLAGSEIEDHGDHLVVRTAAAPDFYWGNFLLLCGGAEVEDRERWLRAFRRHLPGAPHLAVGWDRTGRRDAGRLGRLRAAGLRLDVGAVLTTRVMAPPRPPAVAAAVRPLASSHDWAALLDLRSRIATADGLGSPAHLRFLLSRVREAERLSYSGRAGWVGAFLGERLLSGAGIVVGPRGTARYQSVETDPGFRRRGLAGAVVTGAGKLARLELGAARLVIVADPEGPALGLYRSLGFRDLEFQLSLEAAPVTT